MIELLSLLLFTGCGEPSAPPPAGLHPVAELGGAQIGNGVFDIEVGGKRVGQASVHAFANGTTYAQCPQGTTCVQHEHFYLRRTASANGAEQPWPWPNQTNCDKYYRFKYKRGVASGDETLDHDLIRKQPNDPADFEVILLAAAPPPTVGTATLCGSATPCNATCSTPGTCP